LKQTLDEEKETDKKLTQLSGRINVEAADSEESDEDRGDTRKWQPRSGRPELNSRIIQNSKGENEMKENSEVTRCFCLGALAFEHR